MPRLRYVALLPLQAAVHIEEWAHVVCAPSTHRMDPEMSAEKRPASELKSFDLDARTVTLRFPTEAATRDFVALYVQHLAGVAVPLPGVAEDPK